MKKNITSILRPVILLFIGVFFILACQKINPLEGIDLTVNNNVYKSPILIEFVDANSNSTTIPNDLTVSIIGPNKDLVLTDLGENTFKVAGNLLTLALSEKANPTEANPVEFTVSVKGTNYAATNYTISVTDLASSVYTVPLTNLSSLPDGVKSINKTTSLSTGETIVIPASTNKPEIAKIAITSGTQVFDENGAVINATSVNSNIIQYGTATDDAYNSFPNEGNANTIKFKDGTTDEGSFLQAGIVDIEMTSGGKAVKSFSKPLDITLSINPDLENPETDLPVKVGDQIPVFSYDKNKDEWTEEGISTIAKDANGNLIANFKVPHLSTWIISWKIKGKTCKKSKTFKVRIKSNVNRSPRLVTLTVAFYNKKSQKKSTVTKTVSASNNSTIPIQVRRVPTGYKMLVTGKVKDWNSSDSFTISNICGSSSSGTLTFKAPQVPPPPTGQDISETESDAVKVNLDFTAQCTNKSVNIKPTVFLVVKAANEDQQTISIVEGKATMAMKKNVKYQLTASYNGKNYTGEITINNDNATITSSVGLAGSFPLNKINGEIDAKITYPLTSCK